MWHNPLNGRKACLYFLWSTLREGGGDRKEHFLLLSLLQVHEMKTQASHEGLSGERSLCCVAHQRKDSVFERWFHQGLTFISLQFSSGQLMY
jgi:hypothetical protein